jgi:hypothetical protein
VNAPPKGGSAPLLVPRRLLPVACSLLLLAACGKEVPAGGINAPPQPISRKLEPNEIMPADLDVVVRVDLARLKDALGAEPEKQLAARLGTDPAVADAIRSGRAATLGLRSIDLERGDHVLVVEGDMKRFTPDAASFEAQPSANDKVKVFARKTPTARSGTEVLVLMDDRAVAFASPSEADAVLRVLAEGADDDRGQPTAEGLLSFDMRPRRLSAELEQRFPSIARLVSQVQRVRGSVHVEADALVLRMQVIAKSESSAERVTRFFSVLKEGADPQGASALLRSLEVEPLGGVVVVRLRVPATVVLALLTDAGADAPKGGE